MSEPTVPLATADFLLGRVMATAQANKKLQNEYEELLKEFKWTKKNWDEAEEENDKLRKENEILKKSAKNKPKGKK